MKKYILLLLSILLYNITYSQNSYTVNTVGMTFSPDTVNCYAGDTIHFVLGTTHNAVEVDQSTYVSNGSTSNGGFNFGFGATDYLITTNNQTYYYVCQPHVGMGMKGVIIASIQTGNLDCNGIANGTSLTDDCGDCQQAYIYDFVTHAVTLLNDTVGITLGATEMLVMPDNPMNPYWNANCTIDCNGIVDGSSIMDSCGVCQQSYIYDFITHTVTLLDDTFGITLGTTETLVMANDSMNPYWNSSCSDCNGIANGTSLTDDCGDCQQAYIYDFVTHAVTLLNDTVGITLGATEMLVMPDNPMNPYWNANCTIDCNGIVDGSSIMDSCGVCQQSYIYDFITHTVTLLDDTFGITLGTTETLVMANDPMNPYWNMATINTISYDTLVSSDTTITWNNISLTASGDYVDSSLITVSGCDSIANINFTLDNALTIENIIENTEVVKIIDVLGRECKEKLYNTPLFYIYSNGKIEKKIILKSK